MFKHQPGRLPFWLYRLFWKFHIARFSRFAPCPERLGGKTGIPLLEIFPPPIIHTIRAEGTGGGSGV